MARLPFNARAQWGRMRHDPFQPEHLAQNGQGPAAKADLQLSFRASMRQLAGAVSVVTVGEGANRTGFTATSVTSLSIDPPALLVSLNRNSASWPIVQRDRRFTVNILSSTHQQIAETFAGRLGLKGVDRYADVRWQQRHGQTPALIDALAVIECDLDEAIERYSHAILIGRVLSVTHRAAIDPLVYWQGDYRRLDTDADDR